MVLIGFDWFEQVWQGFGNILLGMEWLVNQGGFEGGKWVQLTDRVSDAIKTRHAFASEKKSAPIKYG